MKKQGKNVVQEYAGEYQKDKVGKQSIYSQTLNRTLKLTSSEMCKV